MAPQLPGDVVQHVLAYLPVRKIFALRRVNREWLAMFEHALFRHMLVEGSKVVVKIGEEHTLTMHCISYSPETGIFTFKPADNPHRVTCHSKQLRRIRVLYSEWPGIVETSNDSGFERQNAGVQNMDSERAQALAKYAQVLFHDKFFEPLRKEYQIYEDPTRGSEKFAGDVDMVLKCHVQPLSPDERRGVTNVEELVTIEAEFVQVRSSWIVCGTANTTDAMFRYQIYQDRYALLDQIIANREIERYNKCASSVLQWITSSAAAEDDATETLVQHLIATKGDLSKYEYVALKLEEQGISRRSMWKHSSVKRFLAGTDTSMTMEEIVSRVVRSEQEYLRQESEPTRTVKSPQEEAASKLFGWKSFRYF